MSLYQEEKVIRLRLPVGESPFDYKEKYPSLFGLTKVGKFNTAPTEDAFIDFVLHESKNKPGDFGYSRYLTEEELEKYIPIFQEIYPNVTADDLRYVHFCWYNCTECESYFDVTEEREFD